MRENNIGYIVVFLVHLFVLNFVYLSPILAAEPKKASEATMKANEQVLKSLPFTDRRDFEDAQKGFIANTPDVIIRAADGKSAWDMKQYSFLNRDSKAPDTVNPSLWRQAQLNNFYGLFKVTDHIYQVRGYDLSNISFIEGDTGYIAVDPLTSEETAKAALDLLYKNIGKKPIVAVIYTHSHLDHWAGVKGIVSEDDVRAGKVRIIASQGFLEHAVSENVYAGNVMGRRALYMYGTLLPKGPRGQVDAGLGKTNATGSLTLIAPTDIISKTGTEMTIDGVKIIFQYTPGTEAPTEMNFYFPQFKALCLAENCNHTLHNLYTLRGAQVRDAKAWSQFLNEAMDLFGDKTDVVFISHHWPKWGKENIVPWVKKQADMYKYIHDQTLHIANQGYTMVEIAERLRLPEELEKEWYNRGYYGSLNHDVKAVYQKYLGWFDGNPANLNPLPPIEESMKFVEFMGGSKVVLAKARKAYKKGDYRWVAEVVNHVVFADPTNREARELQADTLEQLGYQAESGPWRNFYLTGAQELRNGVKPLPFTAIVSKDVMNAMTMDMIFDYMAITLNATKAEGKKIKINWNFTDTKEQYVLILENSTLSYTKDKQLNDVDTTITLDRAALNDIISADSDVNGVIASKLKSREMVIEGNGQKMAELMSLMDKFGYWFNIVTPNK
jgi:alkyl sulfatase BDS1-like metallo-beta-lactamase superfamily hydrolase